MSRMEHRRPVPGKTGKMKLLAEFSLVYASEERTEAGAIVVKGKDEIAALAHAFNRMTRSLSKTMTLLDDSRPKY